jgi:anti-anti-sigma regulatory factor
MNRTFETNIDTPIVVPANLRELVRGQEQCFLERLAPVVREHSITLDFCRVERIDAAGIAALIALYSTARSAGHEFSIVNASRRIDEILCLVGLDGVLESTRTVPCPQSNPCYEETAA